MKIDKIKKLQMQGEHMRQLAIICQDIDSNKIKGLSYFYNNHALPEFRFNQKGDLTFNNIKFTLNGKIARAQSSHPGSIIHGCLTLEWGDNGSIIMASRNCRVSHADLNRLLQKAIKKIDEERAER